MTRPLSLALAALAAVALLSVTVAAGSDPSGPALVTLLAGDPVGHTLNLQNGQPGGRFEDARFLELSAHLDYGVHAADGITVALEEDDRGLILDLGHWKELRDAYGYDEADGGGVGFASIALDGERLKIAPRHETSEPQTLREGQPLFSSKPGDHRASLGATPGHVLLIRVEDKRRRTPPILVKALVVAARPGESVTLRWARL